MKIAIDVDEVLAEYQNGFIEFHNKYYGTNLKRHHFAKSYKLEDAWGGTEDEAIDKVYHFYQTKDFKKMEPVPGAIEAVRKLAQKHDLFVVTSRQNFASPVTLEWLDKHFPDTFSGILFANHFAKEGAPKDKSEICKEIGAELLIDDSLTYAKDCAKKGIKVKLFDRPWNQTENLPKNIQRVFSWQEILKIIN